MAGLRVRLLGIAYAPAWVLVTAAVVVGGLVGAIVGDLANVIASGLFDGVVVGVLVVTSRRRYGGREQMRVFFDVVRAGRLPILRSRAEVLWWKRLLTQERVRRMNASARAPWMLAIAAGYLVLAVIAGSTDTSVLLGSASVVAVAVFWRDMFAVPRILAAVEILEASLP